MGLFLCQGYRMTPLHRGDYGWGHVPWNLGREPPSLRQDIENATLRIWRGFAEEWTKIPPEMCVNLVTNYKKRLTSVLANKGYSTKYEVMFCQGIKYLFPAIKCKSIHNCYKIQNRPTITIIDHAFLCKWANLRNRQGFKYLFSPLYIHIYLLKSHIHPYVQ